jgi:hypothetical protein
MAAKLAESATTRVIDSGIITTGVTTNAPFGAPDEKKPGDGVLT